MTPQIAELHPSFRFSRNWSGQGRHFEDSCTAALWPQLRVATV